MADSELLCAGFVVGETYEVERLLGRGGMGEVWLASHRRVAGKQVAIKVLKRSGDVHPDMLARFKREAEIAARLEHPNIVQVSDFATLPTGEPYLVMEYLRGESLAARLKRGPMPVSEVQALVVQVGSALHTAHGAGVVHRDLKPENIFLVPTPTGDQVKVLDFGISKLVDSRTVQTSDSVLIGTPLYMSPEQALGDNRKITAQSDIFSLASLCFEALTGKAPFAADSLARVVYRVAFESAPSLRSRLPDAPEELAKAIDRALEKRVEERTKDIAAFVKGFSNVALQTRAPAGLAVVGGLATPAGGPESLFGPTLASGHLPSGAPTRAEAKAPVHDEPGPGRGKLVALVAVFATVGLGVGYLVMKGAGTVATVDAGAALATGPDATAQVVVAADAAVVAAVDAAVATLVDAAIADAGTSVAVADSGRTEPKVRPPVKEQLSAEQRELLKNAEASLKAERWSEAIDWTQKPAVADTARAVTLRVLAYCHTGNLGMVNAYKAKLPAAERPAVAKACAAKGIDL